MLRKTLRKQRTIKLCCLTGNDAIVPSVVAFLRANFHSNEPLNRSIQLMSSEQDCKTLDALYTLIIQDNASVVALDEQGTIVAVLLNNIMRRGHTDNDEIPHPDWNPSAAYDKFLDLLTTLHDELDLFTKYPSVDAILDHAILSVCDEWQGDGVSQILVDFSNKVIAKQHGCEMSFVICSSFFSAKVFEKCGYVEILRKNFHDYQENNRVLFPTESPHEFITCKLLKQLPNDKITDCNDNAN